MANKKYDFIEGLRDGLPIGLGYFAVAFSLGITARNAGLNSFEGFLSSILNHASAGEYALYSSIQAMEAYLEVAIITLVVNARYSLMSCSLSQRFNPNQSFFHRILMGFGITDEIFGIAIARPGYLSPAYYYGAMTMSIPLWGLGNALGIWAGNLFPANVVSALSVALYGMFVAIIIPPAKKDKIIALAIVVSFALSYLCTQIPFVKELTDGTRMIVLTVLISSIIAILKPVKEETINSEE